MADDDLGLDDLENEVLTLLAASTTTATAQLPPPTIGTSLKNVFQSPVPSPSPSLLNSDDGSAMSPTFRRDPLSARASLAGSEDLGLQRGSSVGAVIALAGLTPVASASSVVGLTLPPSGTAVQTRTGMTNLMMMVERAVGGVGAGSGIGDGGNGGGVVDCSEGRVGAVAVDTMAPCKSISDIKFSGIRNVSSGLDLEFLNELGDDNKSSSDRNSYEPADSRGGWDLLAGPSSEVDFDTRSCSPSYATPEPFSATPLNAADDYNIDMDFDSMFDGLNGIGNGGIDLGTIESNTDLNADLDLDLNTDFICDMAIPDFESITAESAQPQPNPPKASATSRRPSKPPSKHTHKSKRSRKSHPSLPPQQGHAAAPQSNSILAYVATAAGVDIGAAQKLMSMLLLMRERGFNDTYLIDLGRPTTPTGTPVMGSLPSLGPAAEAAISNLMNALLMNTLWKAMQPGQQPASSMTPMIPNPSIPSVAQQAQQPATTVPNTLQQAQQPTRLKPPRRPPTPRIVLPFNGKAVDASRAKAKRANKGAEGETWLPVALVELPTCVTAKDGLVSCPIEGCRFASRRRFTVKVHFQTHVGRSQRLYACDSCDQAFEDRISLDWHGVDLHLLTPEQAWANGADADRVERPPGAAGQLWKLYEHRKKAEEEERKAAEQRRMAEARKLVEQRMVDEAMRIMEERRANQERRDNEEMNVCADEERKVADQRTQENQKRIDEERRRVDEQRRIAEEKRINEAIKLNEARIQLAAEQSGPTIRPNLMGDENDVSNAALTVVEDTKQVGRAEEVLAEGVAPGITPAMTTGAVQTVPKRKGTDEVAQTEGEDEEEEERLAGRSTSGRPAKKVKNSVSELGAALIQKAIGGQQLQTPVGKAVGPRRGRVKKAEKFVEVVLGEGLEKKPVKQSVV
ncbi:hypothetical protein HK101_001397 [Irineochytrium annulatum]|nr:hypothetical protein HK101_001397 [Irineochytrium annulatum]